MTEKRTLYLVNPAVRQRAKEAISAAPDGWQVTLREPARNLDQNAAMWPILDAFSKQLQWPVNGSMCHLTPEDWKDLLSCAFRQESARVAMGLNGGMVLLGLRTSRMGKREFSDFLEFLNMVAADRGVNLDRKECA